MIAEPEESVDLACSTLLTTVFLLLTAPTTSRPMAVLVLVLAVTVFVAQALFALKLFNNASDPDGIHVRDFLLEGCKGPKRSVALL